MKEAGQLANSRRQTSSNFISLSPSSSLQYVLKELIETEALVNQPQQDSRLMQNFPRLLTAVVDRLLSEGSSTLCSVTMSLLTRLLKQVVDEKNSPFPFAVHAHGQAMVNTLCHTAFKCLSRTALYALLRAMDESSEIGWVDLGGRGTPETPGSAGVSASHGAFSSGRNSIDLSGAVSLSV